MGVCGAVVVDVREGRGLGVGNRHGSRAARERATTPNRKRETADRLSREPLLARCPKTSAG